MIVWFPDNSPERQVIQKFKSPAERLRSPGPCKVVASRATLPEVPLGPLLAETDREVHPGILSVAPSRPGGRQWRAYLDAIARPLPKREPGQGSGSSRHFRIGPHQRDRPHASTGPRFWDAQSPDQSLRPAHRMQVSTAPA
jgi:hypothetical protein